MSLTFWCIRCISPYSYAHNQTTGGGELVQLCQCGVPTPGFFRGVEFVQGDLDLVPVQEAWLR